MKTLKNTIIIVMIFPIFVGCQYKFESQDVFVSLPRELVVFFEDLGINNTFEYIYGNILYNADEEIQCYTQDIEFNNEFVSAQVFDTHYLSGDTQKYTIINEYDDFKLSIKSTQNKYDIELHMPRYSVVCKDLAFHRKDFDLTSDACVYRPCSGSVKMYYHTDENNKILLKELVEATNEKTIWKEYYDNGNIRFVKEIVDNELFVTWGVDDDFDSYDSNSKPFETTIKYYFRDGTEDHIFLEENYAIFISDRHYKFPNSTVHLLLYPHSEIDKSQGYALLVGSDWKLNNPFKIANYSYEIANNKIYFSNGWKKNIFSRNKVYQIDDTSADIINEFSGLRLRMKDYLDKYEPWDLYKNNDPYFKKNSDWILEIKDAM